MCVGDDEPRGVVINLHNWERMSLSAWAGWFDGASKRGVWTEVRGGEETRGQCEVELWSDWVYVIWLLVAVVMFMIR